MKKVIAWSIVVLVFGGLMIGLYMGGGWVAVEILIGMLIVAGLLAWALDEISK